MMSDIFVATKRPDESLFYGRGDRLDPRMGEVVRRDPDDYPDSEIVLVGSPQDFGVRRNRGRPGARKGPEEIRRALYRFPVPGNVSEGLVFDLGDVIIGKTLEETHETQFEIIRKIITDGKAAIILGGGNDISYPDCRALAEETADTLVFNIDSHFDVRESDSSHSGTPYRQLLDEKAIDPRSFYELANKQVANSPEYRKYLDEAGVNVYPLREMRRSGAAAMVRDILEQERGEAIFWGFDIDAVRSTDAPGASAPYPEGLTAEEINEIARVAGADRRSRVLEITEVNPEYDLDNRTSLLAAMIIMNYLWEVPAPEK
jgi:formiminoglutamase